MNRMNPFLLALAFLFTGSMSVASAGDWYTDLPTIAQSKAQVLFFGDSHSQESYKTSFRELLLELHQNDPAWNCVALEMDPSWVQVAVDQVISGTASRADLPHVIHRSVPDWVRGVGYDLPFFQEYVSNFLEEAFFQVLDQTKSRFFAIDLPKTENYFRVNSSFPRLDRGEIPTDLQWDERNRLQMIERNQEMARRIAALIDSGKCSRVLAMVGAHHLTQYGKLILSDEQVVPVPELLQNRFSVETIRLFFDLEEKSSYQRLLAPSSKNSRLSQMPISVITYTPTILSW